MRECCVRIYQSGAHILTWHSQRLHPALSVDKIVVDEFNWIWSDYFPEGICDKGFPARVQFRHRSLDVPCTVTIRCATPYVHGLHNLTHLSPETMTTSRLNLQRFSLQLLKDKLPQSFLENGVLEVASSHGHTKHAIHSIGTINNFLYCKSTVNNDTLFHI